jgi:hypothetical protein
MAGRPGFWQAADSIAGNNGGFEVNTVWLRLVLFAAVMMAVSEGMAESLDFPSSDWGISIGNSTNFTGLRMNVLDHGVDTINGVNLTLWQGYDNEESTVNGISFGPIASAGTLNGLNVGILGAGADREMNGVSVGFLGGGAGGDITGITIGGLGAGAGGSIEGVVLGGLGAGAGGDIRGIALGGLGVGAGGDFTGIGCGLLGAGAGHDATGVLIGGLGVGAGGTLRGVAVGGLGAGAPEVRGVLAGLLGVGGRHITGATLALGMVKVVEEGSLTGLSLSAVNWIEGSQHGLSIGLVNYARRLQGVQIGLVNVVSDSKGWSRILPLINCRL